MTTLFVTAAGTEVGKTFVCCRLIEELRREWRLRVVKPVATGFDPDDVASSDTGRLLAAQGRALDPQSIDATTPWRYRAALSPDMAARRERSEIPFDRLVQFSRAEPEDDLTLIEGIGGVMVPLDATHTVLDWMDTLSPIVWLVVGSYLGSLSHALTALAALDRRGLEVASLIVSESPEQPVDIGETAATLERFAGGVPVRIVPRPPPAPASERLLAPAIEARLAGRRA